MPALFYYLYLQGKDTRRCGTEDPVWKFVSKHENYSYSIKTPVRRIKSMGRR